MPVGTVSQAERRGSRKASVERAGLTCSRNDEARVREKEEIADGVLGTWGGGHWEILK